jgi:uncharacterized repeat protein (TIGR03806 family)
VKYGFALLILTLFACSQQKPTDIVVVEEQPDTLSTASIGKPRLSDYRFFKAPVKNLEPVAGVFPYEINSQLFSDYALKKRFIALPAVMKMKFNNEDTLSFPVGSIVIKNFYYPADFDKPEEDLRIIETRLLIREARDWKPLTYIWNKEQTDAFLEVAGAKLPVSWTDVNGQVRNISYSVPNLNQCKSCHMRSDKIALIGPTARQLNREVSGKNQLVEWAHAGLIEGMPDIAQVSKLASYDDETVKLDARARAWLEVNCAHCHRTDGPAKTSGLHLLASVNDMFHLGVGKPPVAAGKGSGSFKYDIVPGKAELSILYYRIASTDPGVMMPELGRSVAHDEGIQLIKDWINEMKIQ